MQSYLSLKLGDVNLANQQFSIAKAVYDDLQSSDKSSGVTQRDLLILETFNETYLDHAIKQETVDTLGISFEQLHKSDHLAKGIISACIALINNQLGQFEQALLGRIKLQPDPPCTVIGLSRQTTTSPAAI